MKESVRVSVRGSKKVVSGKINISEPVDSLSVIWERKFDKKLCARS